ncbi:citryl-CoA lyase [Brevibacillus choshinensis]|uniref:citrate synthase (unknown stereospecificity) n=1 Tax=Brevibacillus choshinensis TaxID=54911 RepID=A0ABX7FWN3_BRECH|nr:citryl-CoA lyase [Brevibacillus choshinensis]QRG70149.1 citryl-CoA lyase [Brevibacillus choshinensis]
MEFKTQIGVSEPDKIYVHGYDLSEDLIGQITLADMAFLGAAHRKPTIQESRMLNACMVAICEHGFTPSSISARLTYLGAPEAVQAAVAAGLLGAGSVYLGAMEYVAQMLQEGWKKQEQETDVRRLAEQILHERAEQGLSLPGFGHPVHRPVDPRTTKLFALAEELGFAGKHTALMREIHRQFCEKKGKTITLNVAGAIGAVLSDMNMHHSVVKSFAVAARAVGLIGHIVEEIESGRADSMAQQLYDYVEESTVYTNDKPRHQAEE